MTTTVVTCGALAHHVRALADKRGWDVEIRALPPELHNRPERIAPAVAELVAQSHKLSGSCDGGGAGAAEEQVAQSHKVVLAYADCGTGGALDGYARLPGLTCYDVFAHDVVLELLEEQPGTYFLTDFLVRTFDRTIVRSLGLDRHPELRDEYFRNYTRVVWLAQRPTEELRARAERAAAVLGLPLEQRTVGENGLERALEELLC